MMEKIPAILVVDDDERFRERLGKAFQARGHVVLLAYDHASALRALVTRTVERAVVDLRMPGPSGLVLVRDLLELHPTLAVVVLTGYGSVATAVDAVRHGARDYLTKPCHADRILAAFEVEPAEALHFEVPTLASLEREHIERVLGDCNGNISKTARVLGMHRRTLQYKLAKFATSR